MGDDYTGSYAKVLNGCSSDYITYYTNDSNFWRHGDFRKILLKIIPILLQLVPDSRQASTLGVAPLQCWQQS